MSQKHLYLHDEEESKGTTEEKRGEVKTQPRIIKCGDVIERSDEKKELQ